MEKACSKCGTVKPLDEFQKKAGRSDGRRSECKACSKLYKLKNADRIRERERDRYRSDAEWRERKIANSKRSVASRRDEVREYQRIYQSNRANSIHGGRFQWDIALWVYGNRCAICGGSEAKLTVGHIIPVSRGGTNHQWNVRPECLPCNKSKFTRLDCEMDTPPVCRSDLT